MLTGDSSDESGFSSGDELTSNNSKDSRNKQKRNKVKGYKCKQCQKKLATSSSLRTHISNIVKNM